MTRKPTIADGAKRWRQRHPAPIRERSFDDDSLGGSHLARGVATYAARHGNTNAADALTRFEEAGGDDADNVTFNGDAS